LKNDILDDNFNNIKDLKELTAFNLYIQ
jgi:hypothetical protein